MNKFSKVLLASAVVLLAACSSSSKDEAVDGQTFGGYSVQDLQQRYNTVYFGFDRYDIENEYQGILDAHAAYLIATPAARVTIEGNTDERGTPEYNIALGQRRADAVQSYFTSKGVNKGQTSTVSYGEEKPAVLGHDESAYTKNRRAVLAY